MGGRLGKPRGVLPGFSDRPLADRLEQDSRESGENEEVTIGQRVQEAFGQEVRLYPQLMCPGIVDASFVSTRSIERWYVVGAGDYAGAVSIGPYLAGDHPYFDTLTIVRPGDPGLPSRRWTNFNRDAVGVEVELPVTNLAPSAPDPQHGEWSPYFALPTPGGGIVLVFKVEHGSVGWVPDLTTNETDWQLEVEWQRVDNLASTTSTIDLTETAGAGSPQGRVKQYNIPVLLPGRLRVRMRLVRRHASGVNNAIRRVFSIQVFGQRVGENARATFPSCTTMYLKLSGIPGDEVRDVFEQPVSMVATRSTRDWSSAGVQPTTSNIGGDVADAVVQTVADAGRESSTYFDAASWATVKSDLAQLDGGRGGALRMAIKDEMTVEEQLRTLCDHHRLIPVVVGSKLSVLRDQRRDPRTIFTARQKLTPETETVTQRIPDGRDGVRIEWHDRERDVGRELIYPETSLQTNLEELKLPGLGTWEQAYRRARFEWLKLQTRRRELEVTLTEEARHLRPGDRIIIADSLADPGTYVDGWGRLNEDAGIQVLVEDPDLDVISTAPGSVIYVRGPSGLDYHVSGASYFSDPPRIVMSANAPFTSPSARAQQTLPFILGDQVGAGGVETNLTWVVATVADNRDGTVSLTCYDYADVYAGDFEGIPVDPWHERDAISTFETADDPDP